MGEWVKTDKCEIVARLMTAIHCSSYNEVKNVLDFSRTCGNSELIVNCHCGAMKVRPLQLASSLKNQQDAANIVKLLLDHGAKLPVPVGGRTPLHEAVKGGHITCVKILLEKDANVNASDENSLSPLLLASAEVTSGNNKILSIERKVIHQCIEQHSVATRSV
ncbi:ankyrin repeat domain-containing protein 61-like isoform X2 [Lycorma delicatula]|uniref:ankyrin repeat domain-containing protein 61-like isoform X2 n=1 Tax=Lycorma delicatula TaxID=130591 RepID=UPI003F514A22